MATIKLCVLNSDGSNRHASINNATSLADYVKRRLVDEKLKPSENDCLITASEFIKTAAEKLKKKLPETFDYYTGKFKGSDQTAFYWDEKTWAAECKNGSVNIIWSDHGKYAAVVLENESLNQRILYASVHLPLKLEPRKKSYFLLNKFIEEAPEDIDGVIIAGDFNTKPSKLQYELRGMTYGIDDDTIKTTRAKDLPRSIDNVVTSESITPIVKVYKKHKELSHFPLFADLTIKDTEDPDSRESGSSDEGDDD